MSVVIGPEHYLRAQTHIEAAHTAAERGDHEGTDRHLRFAQVHAQLATAAAAALATDLMNGFDAYEWRKAASARPRANASDS